MPKIYDNIHNKLSHGLNETLRLSKRGDFCVGYFNLRGWHEVADTIDALAGMPVVEKKEAFHRYCRLLVGMQKMPLEILRESFLYDDTFIIDQAEMLKLKKKLAYEFKEQLTIGTPTERDEKYLRKLSVQLKEKRVVVKLHLKHPLHAKLYLAHSNDVRVPVVGFLGSSNLTLAGVSKQGELNIDVMDQDAACKLSQWFAEFYEIIVDGGGFDVIIGNPPYVSYAKVKGTYHINENSCKTLECNNLYAFICERELELSAQFGKFGVILPLSSTNANGNSSFQNLIRQLPSLYVSHFAVRPSKLFVGVDMNLTIIVGSNAGKGCNTSAFIRWPSEYRPYLFDNLKYSKNNIFVKDAAVPKFGMPSDSSIWCKLHRNRKHLSAFVIGHQTCKISFHGFGRYWRKCIKEKLSDNYQEFSISAEACPFALCSLNSQLSYWYWIVQSDCYRFTKTDALNFPINDYIDNQSYAKYSKEIIDSYEKNSAIQEKTARNGELSREKQYFPQKSKPIIDQIDALLAQHYGFTHEELDFIINYDIKYRMGKELENEEN